MNIRIVIASEEELENEAENILQSFLLPGTTVYLTSFRPPLIAHRCIISHVPWRIMNNLTAKPFHMTSNLIS